MPLQWRNQFWQSLEEGAAKRCSKSNSKHWFTTSFLQWRNQIRQSLEEGAGKRCSESNSKHSFTTSFLQWCNQIRQSLEEGAGKRCSESNSKHWFTTSFLQWRNQIRQSLEEGAGKRCSERVTRLPAVLVLRIVPRNGRVVAHRAVGYFGSVEAAHRHGYWKPTEKPANKRNEFQI